MIRPLGGRGRAAFRRDVVLVGAGHTHVQLLARWGMKPPPGIRLTLIVDTPVAIYSGMVPGLVEGRYRREELEIDAVPLARRAGARVVLARALGVDPVARRIAVDGRPAIPYDLASFDVGSSVAGLELPGVAEHALATRPIGRFVDELGQFDRRLAEWSGDLDVVVVGGGAGGVELAATVCARATRLGATAVRLRLVHAGERLVPERSPRLGRHLATALAARGVEVEGGCRVAAIDARHVHLDDGGSRRADLVLWAVGSAPHRELDTSALSRDERGFVLVEDTLEVVGTPGLFAAGDCASLREARWVPKAGVYAVRAAPVLANNVERALAGAPLRHFRPQREFLTLLNLGDGEAVGERNGVVMAGHWVMRWKDWIDRRFVERFRRLDHDGVPSASDSRSGTRVHMGGDSMVCGGCAAKLGADQLARVLRGLDPGPRARDVVLGLDDADDVVAWRTPAGDTVVGNVELLRAFGTDPYVLGRVAAVNALSDLDAKGARPRFAQAIVALPLEIGDREAERLLAEILAGARAAFDPRSVGLLGGHTARAAELMVGFAIDGIADGTLWLRQGSPEVGDVVILSRPLGSGVLLHADMAGRARGPWVEALEGALVLGNGAAAASLRGVSVRAASDVTGFGLLGHLLAMIEGSSLAALVDPGALVAMPGALELLEQGERSSFHHQNEESLAAAGVIAGSEVDRARFALALDPQTAGGLLIIVSAAGSADVLQRLAAAGGGETAKVVARLEPRLDGEPPIRFGSLDTVARPLA